VILGRPAGRAERAPIAIVGHETCGRALGAMGAPAGRRLGVVIFLLIAIITLNSQLAHCSTNATTDTNATTPTATSPFGSPLDLGAPNSTRNITTKSEENSHLTTTLSNSERHKQQQEAPQTVLASSNDTQSELTNANQLASYNESANLGEKERRLFEVAAELMNRSAASLHEASEPDELSLGGEMAPTTSGQPELRREGATALGASGAQRGAQEEQLGGQPQMPNTVINEQSLLGEPFGLAGSDLAPKFSAGQPTEGAQVDSQGAQVDSRRVQQPPGQAASILKVQKLAELADRPEQSRRRPRRKRKKKRKRKEELERLGVGAGPKDDADLSSAPGPPSVATEAPRSEIPATQSPGGSDGPRDTTLAEIMHAPTDELSDKLIVRAPPTPPRPQPAATPTLKPKSAPTEAAPQSLGVASAQGRPHKAGPDSQGEGVSGQFAPEASRDWLQRPRPAGQSPSSQWQQASDGGVWPAPKQRPPVQQEVAPPVQARRPAGDWSRLVQSSLQPKHVAPEAAVPPAGQWAGGLAQVPGGLLVGAQRAPLWHVGGGLAQTDARAKTVAAAVASQTGAKSAARAPKNLPGLLLPRLAARLLAQRQLGQLPGGATPQLGSSPLDALGRQHSFRLPTHVSGATGLLPGGLAAAEQSQQLQQPHRAKNLLAMVPSRLLAKSLLRPSSAEPSGKSGPLLGRLRQLNGAGSAAAAGGDVEQAPGSQQQQSSGPHAELVFVNGQVYSVFSGSGAARPVGEQAARGATSGGGEQARLPLNTVFDHQTSDSSEFPIFEAISAANLAAAAVQQFEAQQRGATQYAPSASSVWPSGPPLAPPTQSHARCDRPRHIIQADRTVVNHILASEQNFVIARVPIKKLQASGQPQQQQMAAQSASPAHFGSPFGQSFMSSSQSQPMSFGANQPMSFGQNQLPYELASALLASGSQTGPLQASSSPFASSFGAPLPADTPGGTTIEVHTSARPGLLHSLGQLLSQLRGRKQAAGFSSGSLAQSSNNQPLLVATGPAASFAGSGPSSSLASLLGQRQFPGATLVIGARREAAPQGPLQALGEALEGLLRAARDSLWGTSERRASAQPAGRPSSFQPGKSGGRELRIVDHSAYAASLITSQFSATPSPPNWSQLGQIGAPLTVAQPAPKQYGGVIVSGGSGPQAVGGQLALAASQQEQQFVGAHRQIDPMRRLLMLKTASDNEVCSPIGQLGAKIKYSCVPNSCVVSALAAAARGLSGPGQQPGGVGMQPAGNRHHLFETNQLYSASNSMGHQREVQPSAGQQVVPAGSFEQQPPIRVTYTHLNAYETPAVAGRQGQHQHQFVGSLTSGQAASLLADELGQQQDGHTRALNQGGQPLASDALLPASQPAGQAAGAEVAQPEGQGQTGDQAQQVTFGTAYVSAGPPAVSQTRPGHRQRFETAFEQSDGADAQEGPPETGFGQVEEPNEFLSAVDEQLERPIALKRGRPRGSLGAMAAPSRRPPPPSERPGAETAENAPVKRAQRPSARPEQWGGVSPAGKQRRLAAGPQLQPEPSRTTGAPARPAAPPDESADPEDQEGGDSEDSEGDADEEPQQVLVQGQAAPNGAQGPPAAQPKSRRHSAGGARATPTSHPAGAWHAQMSMNVYGRRQPTPLPPPEKPPAEVGGAEGQGWSAAPSEEAERPTTERGVPGEPGTTECDCVRAADQRPSAGNGDDQDEERPSAELEPREKILFAHSRPPSAPRLGAESPGATSGGPRSNAGAVRGQSGAWRATGGRAGPVVSSVLPKDRRQIAGWSGPAAQGPRLNNNGHNNNIDAHDTYHGLNGGGQASANQSLGQRLAPSPFGGALHLGPSTKRPYSLRNTTYKNLVLLARHNEPKLAWFPATSGNSLSSRLSTPSTGDTATSTPSSTLSTQRPRSDLSTTSASVGPSAVESPWPAGGRRAGSGSESSGAPNGNNLTVFDDSSEPESSQRALEDRERARRAQVRAQTPPLPSGKLNTGKLNASLSDSHTSSAGDPEQQRANSAPATRAKFKPSSVNEILAQARLEANGSSSAGPHSSSRSLGELGELGGPPAELRMRQAGSQGANGTSGVGAAASSAAPTGGRQSAESETGRGRGPVSVPVSGSGSDGDSDSDSADGEPEVTPHQYQIQLRWSNETTGEGVSPVAAANGPSQRRRARQKSSPAEGRDTSVDKLSERVRDRLFEHREEEHWHDKRWFKKGQAAARDQPRPKLDLGPQKWETPIGNQLRGDENEQEERAHFAIPTKNFRQSPRFVQWAQRDVNLKEWPGEPEAAASREAGRVHVSLGSGRDLGRNLGRISGRDSEAERALKGNTKQ